MIDWIMIKPCDSMTADYISMKMAEQLRQCDRCDRCIGEMCDIHTTCEEEAAFGKYLIQQQIGEQD